MTRIMYKKAFIAGVCLVLILMVSGSASAVPVTYTFSGQITGLSDVAGLGAAAGYTAVGQAISYSFVVDTALPGSWTLAGSTSNPGCGADTCYYADYLSGGVAGGAGPGFNYTGQYHYNVESNTTGLYASQGLINVSRGFDNGFESVVFNLSTYHTNPDISTITHWETGVTPFIGFNQARRYTLNSFGGYDVSITEIWSQLILTSGPAVGVPEPGTMLLLGSGLLGLVLLGRKKIFK